MYISVIIPNYNGVELLRKYLVPNYEILKKIFLKQFELIITDDGSKDQSEEYVIGLKLSQIRFIKHKGIRGFGNNCNFAAAQAVGDVLFLLNNDVKLDISISFLTEKLLSPDVFAVVPRIIRPLQDNTNESITFAKIKYYGIDFDHLNMLQKDENHDALVLWACGAATICKKDIFNTLGGFSKEFNPFYVEDADLSMKAWRKGYKSIYIAQARVFHYHNATIPKLVSRRKIETLFKRNKYIYLFKHFSKDSHLLPLKIVLFHIITLHLLELWYIFLAVIRLQRENQKYEASGLQILSRIKENAL